MIDEVVPEVLPRSGADIDEEAYAVLCKLFPQPQNAFRPQALINLLEHGGLEALKLTYGVADLPYGEEAKFDAGENEILLSRETYYGLKADKARARFTLAHELGHAILHGPLLKNGQGRVPRKFYKRTTLPAYLDPEWQANRFAGGFLMPNIVMGKCIREGWSLRKIARYFGVSLEAASIRRAKMLK